MGFPVKREDKGLLEVSILQVLIPCVCPELRLAGFPPEIMSSRETQWSGQTDNSQDILWVTLSMTFQETLDHSVSQLLANQGQWQHVLTLQGCCKGQLPTGNVSGDWRMSAIM